MTKPIWKRGWECQYTTDGKYVISKFETFDGEWWIIKNEITQDSIEMFRLLRDAKAYVNEFLYGNNIANWEN
jgi:hypothetical protein